MLSHVRRRDGLRRAFTTSCAAVRLASFTPAGHRILDLSHRGALLRCEGELEAGDEVVLSFAAPGGQDVIDAVASVCRVTEVDGERRAGLRFTELEWESRAALFVGLAGIPPRVPSQRPLVDYASTVRRIAMTAAV
jgi:c-di-GMP-binding flagellar brake protein YcgR